MGRNLQEGADDLDFAVCCEGCYVSSDPTGLKMALIIFSSLEMLQVAVGTRTQACSQTSAAKTNITNLHCIKPNGNEKDRYLLSLLGLRTFE